MKLLKYDTEAFETHFEKRPFSIGHSLASHTLFSTEKLIELANFLAPERRILNSGLVPVSLQNGGKANDGLTVEETIRKIGELNTWVGLKMISRHPEYRALIDQILDELQPEIDRTHPGMYDREAHIVISSPNSVTPFHMDKEHLFFFHIQGRKEFTAFDPTDRELVSETALEWFFTQDNRRMELPDHMISRGMRMMLQAGDGMHIPVRSPHFVTTFEDVCISLSVTYRTPASESRRRLHGLNCRMRDFRINPSPAGRHPRRDRLKLKLFDAYRSTCKVLGISKTA
mgnify:CR=1 FL=1